MTANLDQADRWNGNEGKAWAEYQDRHDVAVHAYQTHLLDAAAIATHERVLDIGCGCGESTRGAARRAESGSALGIDLSLPMLERARTRASQEGIDNVTFEQADAQVHPFEAGTFDVAISRFGVMFFDDPLVAFTNVARALRNEARLALVAWQPLEENEWLAAVRSALAMGRTVPAPQVGMPGPFGLADPDAVRHILGNAGFADVGLTGLREPLNFGADAVDAFGFVSHLPPVRGLLADLDDATQERALEQLRDALVAHETADGVLFGGSAWLVTAHRG